jgi:hypothetical protein
MASDTVTKSNVYVEDMAIATGGTTAEETGTRETSTGGSVTLTKLDASHIKFRTLPLSLDDLVDGGKDVIIKPLNVDVGGTLAVMGTTTLSTLTPAGYVKNSAAGVLSTGAIAAVDLPTAIDAVKIANGNISNAEFQYLDGVTSAIQTQLNNRPINGSAKFWANFDGTNANPPVIYSFNVDSIIRNATGTYTINFTTPFSSAYYVVNVNVVNNDSLKHSLCYISELNASYATVLTFMDAGAGFNLNNYSKIMVFGFGDQ